MKIKTALLLISCLLLSGCSDNKTENSESVNIDSIATVTTTVITELTTENTTEEYYDIPELTGLSFNEAKEILEEFGMIVERKEKYSDDVPVDYVISYPHRKYSKNKNKISLTVSKGKAISIGLELLFDNRDKSVAEKIKIIEDAGIKTELEYEIDNIDAYNVTNPQEMISKIDPDMAAKGETVTVSVVKPPIKIIEPKIDINSAGGCSVPFTIKNLTDKQIAYINIDFYFYNTMGDPAYCDIKNQYVRRVRLTGPINGGEEIPYTTEPIIYNSTVGAVFPKLILIEYTDGSITSINNVAYWANKMFYGGKLNDN